MSQQLLFIVFPHAAPDDAFLSAFFLLSPSFHSLVRRFPFQLGMGTEF